jgi:hypothetical protein
VVRTMEFSRVARILCAALGMALIASSLKAQSAGEGQRASLEQINPLAKELLDKTVQALGGSAFLQATNLTTRGRVFIISEGATSGFAKFENTDQYPDKRRFGYGKDNNVVLVNNGERGWQIDRFGIIRQKRDQVHAWMVANRYSLENMLREVVREPGLLIQDGGTDFVDNLPARVVEIVDSRQVRIKIYIHKMSFLPIRITYRVQDPETHEWQEFADVYGDYRPIQGIQTPFHVTRLKDGRRYIETFRNFAVYNRQLPENYFTPGG